MKVVPTTRLLVLLFIVLSAVSAHAQTPIKPFFSTRPDQLEKSEDSQTEDSAEQAEASEDSPPEGSAEQTEVNEDSPSAHSAEQIEVSEEPHPVYPDEQPKVREKIPPAHSSEKPDFFIAPLAEITGYSRDGISFGAGFALGAGNGVAIGARFLYAVDTESLRTMEIAVFMRFYLQGAEACTGPFIQLIAGASIHNKEHAAVPPVRAGSLSAGIAAGWRVSLSEHWYMEPAIRAGYPYIAGAGISFAFRF